MAVERELATWRRPRREQVASFTPVEVPSRTRLRPALPHPIPQPPREDEAAGFWSGLTSGRLGVLETFASDDYCCVIAEERNAPEAHALTDREIVLLHRTFQAETQKVLADGFDLSVAAISQLLGGALHKLGVVCRVSCTPLPIVLAALRHCGVIELPRAYVSRSSERGKNWSVMALPALDPTLLPGLSRAEREVAIHHVVGATHGEIGSRRDTSSRTIANQIASLSKKLGVHGRFDLIRYWARLQWGNVGTS